MAYGLSWISYRSAKTTTIQKTFVGTTSFERNINAAGANDYYFSFDGATTGRSAGTTNNASLTSETFSNTGKGVRRFFFPFRLENFDFEPRFGTTLQSRSLNSTTWSETNQSTSFSTSSSDGSFTIRKETTSVTQQQISVLVTSQRTQAIGYYTTTLPEGATKATTTFETRETTQLSTTRISSNLQTTVSTLASETLTLTTYTGINSNAVLVYDTIYIAAQPWNAGTNYIINKIGQETIGVNRLAIEKAAAFTLSWQPPVFVEISKTTRPTRTIQQGEETATTWATPAAGIVTETTTINEITETTRSFIGITAVTATVENWVTFTTSSLRTFSNASAQSVTIISCSLDTGFTEIDDEGQVQTYQFNSTSFQTNKEIQTIEIFVSKTTQTEFLTGTYGSYKETSETLGIQLAGKNSFAHGFNPIASKAFYLIRTNQIPWGANDGGLLEPKSLISESSITTSTSFRKYAAYTYSVNNLNSTSGTRQLFADGEASTATASNSYRDAATEFSDGNFYSSFTRSTYRHPGPRFAAFASQLSYTQASPNAHNFSFFDISPNKTAAPLLIDLEGNQHTIPLPHDLAANIVPRLGVGLIFPTFSTVINRAPHGGGLHTSDWSSITLSREGDILSSTWSSFVESNDSGTIFTTESGQCSFTTKSNFPFGVAELDWKTLGGAMQPNSEITLFKAPVAALTIAYDSSGSSSGFFTENDFKYEKTQGQTITIATEIPIIGGQGVITQSLLDNGLP